MTHKDKTIERMASEIWEAADNDGYFILAGRRGIKTYHASMLAEAAYEASGAEHIPALVEAVKVMRDLCCDGSMSSMVEMGRIADKVLDKLPEELRGE